MPDQTSCTMGMVSAPHRLAAEAGQAVINEGGSAIEATVAMAACLSVVYPHMTGIGGDGFWLVYEPDGTVWSINACGRTPLGLDGDLYAGLDTIPWRGPLSANTVAGTISGWHCALASRPRHLPLERLLDSAISHAQNGVAVTKGGAGIAHEKGAELRCQPGAYADIFEPEGAPLREGDILRQPALAESLQQLATEGLDSFYRGALADRIAHDLAELGSPVTRSDLAAHQAGTPHPLTVKIEGAQLFNTTPPTQGLASLLILALFDRLAANKADSFDHLHGLIEATKQAFLIRDRRIGDPTIMNFDPQALLDDNAALDAIAAAIDPQRAVPWPRSSALGDTCWFGAADSSGQVVSAIQSTYFEFGSGVVLPQTGITWQNRGCSFALSGDGPNRLGPGRVPFHTLNPALAKFHDGRVLAYGAMGGEGQPQTQAAIFSRYARLGVPLAEAIAAPRWLLGRTWGEDSTSLKLESRFPPELVQALREAGHEVEVVDAMTAMMGHAGAVLRHPDGGFEGASDPRSDGAALGA